MAYDYDYNEAGASGGDSWTADDGMDDGGYGIVPDLGPGPSPYGDVGIDPSLLSQPDPGHMYPHDPNGSYGAQNGVGPQ
ncbi:hypothetical protein PG997_011837 [Apiospora hydei]|uniref:Uncharacterized protein n=1 Tax=Apiospora hydei TaxID=1337664 RepID=A0ABR1V493_9PEZI